MRNMKNKMRKNALFIAASLQRHSSYWRLPFCVFRSGGAYFASAFFAFVTVDGRSTSNFFAEYLWGSVSPSVSSLGGYPLCVFPYFSLIKPNILGDFAQAKYGAKREGSPAARFMQGRIENACESAEENVSWEYLRQILCVCVTKKRALAEV